jgi:hypothetical protein
MNGVIADQMDVNFNLLRETYLGVSSFAKKICCSGQASKAIASATDGIKSYLKRMIKNIIF